MAQLNACPVGNQEVAGSIPTRFSNMLSWRRLIMKYLCTYNYSRRFVHLSVLHPSHFCPQHISKSIEGNMKLDTLIEGH